MEVLLRVVAGVLLIAHGLVHLLYFVTNPEDPRWPFTLDRSWLLGEAARRPVAIGLASVTIVGFTFLGLGVWGVPGLSAVWPVFAIVGAGGSLALLVLFWNVQLVFGVVLSLAVLALAVWRPGWTSLVG